MPRSPHRLSFVGIAFALGLAMMFGVAEAARVSGSNGPQSFSISGGSEQNVGKFFLQPGSSFRGDLMLTGSNFMEVRGLDLSDFEGDSPESGVQEFIRFGLQDSAAGFRSFGIQVIADINGDGGHLLQSFENGGTPGFAVRSSHGFNAGDVTGPMDLRLEFVQDVQGGPWEITPKFRLSGEANFTTFFDGSWTTTDSFDITEGLVFVDMGADDATTASVDNILVNWDFSSMAPIPALSEWALMVLALLLVGVTGHATIRHSTS